MEHFISKLHSFFLKYVSVKYRKLSCVKIIFSSSENVHRIHSVLSRWERKRVITKENCFMYILSNLLKNSSLRTLHFICFFLLTPRTSPRPRYSWNLALMTSLVFKMDMTIFLSELKQFCQFSSTLLAFYSCFNGSLMFHVNHFKTPHTISDFPLFQFWGSCYQKKWDNKLSLESLSLKH